jgi:BirA family biotin operon repressor/biotin-[acetyl-CoA-carboxylase] ligase
MEGRALLRPSAPTARERERPVIDPAAQVPLSIEEIRRARSLARIGRSVHYCERVNSTNTLASQLARDGAPDGTVVIAETQTKGRGRLGRFWVSPPYRNLYLSAILRPPIAASEAPQITLVAGLAVAETVREWTPHAAIKWPNDVLIDGRKVAGILTEMEAEEGRVGFVILGIGVNLNSATADFPEELQDRAIGLCTAAHAVIDRTVFATHLLARLEERYELFLRQGFAAIRPLWEGLSCLTGRRVDIDGGGERHTGVVIGLGADGALRLQGPAGQEISVVAGDVTVVDGYA